MFPLMPLLIRSLPAAPDVLVASSSGWAHALRADGPKIVYCHTPARWLYQPADYFGTIPAPLRKAVSIALRPLRQWDRRHAMSASVYIANSTVVAQRIWDIYRLRARIIFPAVGLDTAGAFEPVAGIEPGFFLTVGRRRGYKHTRKVCEAVEKVADARLVCVGGAPGGRWSRRITQLHSVPDAQLRWLYSNARAVVAVAHEDFGLTPVEGHSFGTPSIVRRAGGYLDSCIAGLDTTFVETDSVDELARAISSFHAADFDAEVIRRHAQRFSRTAFVNEIRSVVDALTWPWDESTVTEDLVAAR
jgi:glycosyltransferase involved in cell wall biosynthesis